MRSTRAGTGSDDDQTQLETRMCVASLLLAATALSHRYHKSLHQVRTSARERSMPQRLGIPRSESDNPMLGFYFGFGEPKNTFYDVVSMHNSATNLPQINKYAYMADLDFANRRRFFGLDVVRIPANQRPVAVVEYPNDVPLDQRVQTPVSLSFRNIYSRLQSPLLIFFVPTGWRLGSVNCCWWSYFCDLLSEGRLCAIRRRIFRPSSP